MGKCTNCGTALDPGWKFCIACGERVEPAESAESVEETGAMATSKPEPIPSAIRPDEPDEPLPRKRVDAALIFGIVMAVGGGVLIILVAIALFSPRG
jgi:uncharacterized OB-fold protein